MNKEQPTATQVADPALEAALEKAKKTTRGALISML